MSFHSSRSLRSAAVLASIAVVGVVLAACSSSSDGSGTDNPVVSSSSSTTSSTPVASGKCAYPADGSKLVVGTPATTDLLAPTTLTLTLALGADKKPETVAITLKADATPCTVNAISYLASKKYFDGTKCHRLTTPDSGISVLQCGDPTGSGAGTPGFSYADELTGSETYPAGTVAMANAGPNTNGSQFFLVYGATPLPAKYTVFGTITAGLDVIAGVGADGTAEGGPDGTPKTAVEIVTASAK